MNKELLFLFGIVIVLRLIYLISRYRQGFGAPFVKIPIFSDPYGLVSKKKAKKPQRILLVSEIIIETIIGLFAFYMIIKTGGEYGEL